MVLVWILEFCALLSLSSLTIHKVANFDSVTRNFVCHSKWEFVLNFCFFFCNWAHRWHVTPPKVPYCRGKDLYLAPLHVRSMVMWSALVKAKYFGFTTVRLYIYIYPFWIFQQFRFGMLRSPSKDGILMSVERIGYSAGTWNISWGM